MVHARQSSCPSCAPQHTELLLHASATTGPWANVRRVSHTHRPMVSSASVMEQQATAQDAGQQQPHPVQHDHQEQGEAPKQPCLQATGYEARVIGAMVGALCGDVLGHPWEAQSLNNLKQQHPSGITDFAAAPELRCYTGEIMLEALLAVSPHLQMQRMFMLRHAGSVLSTSQSSSMLP